MRLPISDRSARTRSRRLSLSSIEALEDRRLMAVSITEVPLDHATHRPVADILPMSDGSLYFTGYNDNGVLNGMWKRSPDGQVSSVQELNTLIRPGQITSGPNGSIWVASGMAGSGNQVTRLAGGVATNFNLPGEANSLAFGPDGNLWIAMGSVGGSTSGAIVRMTPEGQTLRTTSIYGTTAISLVAGTSNDVWFSEPGLKSIARMTTDGTVFTFPVDAEAENLALGADGSVWFTTKTTDNQGAIGQLFTNGSVLISPLGARSVATSVSPAADGSAWFTDSGLDVVGKLAPNGQITSYPTPKDQTSPFNLVGDGSGGFWYVETSSTFGRVATGVAEPTIKIVGRQFTAKEGPVTQDTILAAFTTTDLTATASDFLARVDLGTATSQSLNGEIRADGPGKFVVLAPRGGMNTAGTALMTITVMDAKNQNAVGTSSTYIGVAKFDAILPVVTGRDGTVAARQELTLAVADFADAVTTVAQTISINWGDGTTSEGTLDSWVNGGRYIQGTHSYARPGTYTVTTTVRDSGTPVVATSVMTVTPAVLVSGAYEAAPSTFALNAQPSPSEHLIFATGITTVSVSDFVATIDWGDGTTSSGVVSPYAVTAADSPIPMSYSVTADHLYNAVGTYTITVRIAAADGMAEEYVHRRTVTVETAPVPVPPSAGLRLEGKTLSGTQGTELGVVVAKFYDFKFTRMPDYSATVVWGDGSESPGVISVYDGQMVVYATHTYANPGTYAYGVIVGKFGFAPETATGTVVVDAKPVAMPEPVPPAPVTPAPPRVTILSARAFTFARRRTRIVLRFSGNVDADSVVDLTRYRVTQAGKDRKLGTADDRTVRIRATMFNALTNTLTLTPRGTFPRRMPINVAIRDESVVSVAWAPVATAVKTRS